jgi:alpha-beta hydrolase superfamily lysophospholipase
MIRLALKVLARAAVAVLVIAATIVLVRAFDSRRLPELKPWHEVRLESEFTDEDFSGSTFTDYLEVEERVFEELEEKVSSAVPAADEVSHNRFYPGGNVYPAGRPVNWNRSFEMTPDGPALPAGGILLLHGLTDSPYSVRSLAEIFRARGFYVLAPRLPGHGTAPSGLRYACWQDWMAVLKLSLKHVRAVIGDDRPLYIGGYSNGGTLAVKYTLDSLEDEGLETPERLFLFSPAIGVTRFAAFATWHKVLSFLPWFEKFSWESVLPEYDPYKYNSFPKNAGHQTYVLTKIVQERVEAMAGSGKLDRLPPVIAFQSLVDATVLTPSLVSRFLEKLQTTTSELVLLDINRFNPLQRFLRHNVDALLHRLERSDRLPFELTVVTNSEEGSIEVAARRRAAESPGFSEGEALGLSWPPQVYSLSHVAIPFPPDDPVYGVEMDPAGSGMNLGTLGPRGEKRMLLVPIDTMMRLRYNPFFDYLEKRVVEFCADCRSTG